MAVSCTSSGAYSWNATLTDAAAYSRYAVYANTSWYRNGGGGGTFGYPYQGDLVTGRYGSGTSSTFYGNPGYGTVSVTVTARIAGVYGSDTDSC